MKKIFMLLFIGLMLVFYNSTNLYAQSSENENISIRLESEQDDSNTNGEKNITLSIQNKGKTALKDLNVEYILSDNLRFTEEIKVENYNDIKANDKIVYSFKVGKKSKLWIFSLFENIYSKFKDSNGFLIGGGLFLVIFIIASFLNKSKQKKLKVFMLLSLLTSSNCIQNIYAEEKENVEFQHRVTLKEYFQINDEACFVEVLVKYGVETTDEYPVQEPQTEQLLSKYINKSKTAHLQYSDELPVTSVNVKGILKKGIGTIKIRDNESESQIDNLIGAISHPINITLENDELESANIIFAYDEKKLSTNPDNLAVAWYDEKNNEVVVLDNSIVDHEKQTVSVSTTHFSEYILLNKEVWYQVWAKEQLVIRDEKTTPSYNVVFALDNSGSMDGRNLQLCKDATVEFITLLHPKDKVSVMTFNSQAKTYVESVVIENYGVNEIIDDINNIEADGLTNYSDGLGNALSLVVASREEEDREKDISRQSLIVFLSDGDPTTNYTYEQLDQLAYFAESSNCKCVTIGLGNNVSDTYLTKMAVYGDGMYKNIKDVSELKDLFNTINDSFIGATKDSDEDGLPDIVETTGMRTYYGDFIRTNPDNKDTDGDGLDDGKEMGTFIFVTDGKSYFKNISNPNIPTVVEEEKQKINNVHLDIDKSDIYSKYLEQNNNNSKIYTYENLKNDFTKCCISVFFKAPKYKIANDLLSETIYLKNEKYKLKISMKDSCIKMKNKTHEFEFELKPGDEKTFKCQFECKNNFVDCTNKHNYTVELIQDNVVIDSKTYTNVNEEKKSLLNSLLTNKINLMEKENKSRETKLSEDIKQVNSDINTIKKRLIDDSLSVISDELIKQFVVDDLCPNNVKAEFVSKFKDSVTGICEIKDINIDNLKDYFSFTLKVLEGFSLDDGYFSFFVRKGDNIKEEYIFEYHSVGFLSKYIQGKIYKKNTSEYFNVGYTQVNKDKFNKMLKDLKILVVEEVVDAGLDAIKDFAGNIDLKKASRLYGDLSDSEWLSLLKKKQRETIVNLICNTKDVISRLIDLKEITENIKDKSKDKKASLDLLDEYINMYNEISSDSFTIYKK